MKNALPPIALQLSHPDAFFYEVSADSKTISGLFEAHDKGQPFEISVGSFVVSAYTLDYIDDYELQSGWVFVGDSSGGKGYQLDGWLQDFIERGNGLQAVLRHAVEAEFETEMARLSRVLNMGLVSANFISRFSRSVDTEFCDAVLALADIIRAANGYEADVKAANEPQPPTDSAKLVKELAVDVLAMGELSAAVVLNTLAGSMYAGQDRALAQVVAEYNEKVLLPYVKAGIAAKRAAQN